MNAAQRLLLLGNPSYVSSIRKLSPLALWSLSEITGTNAADISSGYDGTYAGGVTLNAATFPDGTPAPLFDANAEVVTLPFTALDTPFDGAVGTLAFWYKVRAASVWTDGASRIPISFGVDASNRIFPTKSSVNNSYQMSYRAGGTVELHTESTFSPSTWFHTAITWDAGAADEANFYINAALKLNSATLGIFAGTLTNALTAIGNFSGAGGANHADGYIKYVGLWNRVLTQAEISSLVPASFLV